MKVLVIGGTGFIGPPAVRRLAEDGHEVCVLSRGSSAAALPAGVRTLRGDRRRLSASRDALRALKADVVVDVVLASGRQAAELMETFRGAAGRVVAISSQDVYRACGLLHGLEPGPLEPVPLTEHSALRTRVNTYPPPVIAMLKNVFSWLDDEYDKIPVEQAVMDDPALPGTVLRLPMVYGPGDPLHRLFPIVKRIDDRRPAILLHAGMAGWRSTRGYVEDVGAAIALAATRDEAAGRVYNVGEPAAHSELEWTRAVCGAAGYAGEVVALPPAAAPAHLQPPGNVEQHWTTSTALIREELGFAEVVAPAVALARTIDWERAHPPSAVDAAQFDYAAEDGALAAWRLASLEPGA